ncbi:MAG: class I SAM-dependent methyltransferase [Balneolaceae bacterium]|nr:class I SAM-dependent methyltransferase [Balneolaceae bacterium]
MSEQHYPEYSKLAPIYDQVMEDVSYEVWADFIDEVVQVHHPDPLSILELACGTGSLALSLDELGCYDITATDKSPEMIKIARKKCAETGCGVEFMVMDFLDIRIEQPVDVVLSTFDSINYLHRSRDIIRLLEQVRSLLQPHSLFVFDFTTPKNSIKSIKFLNNEEGYTDDNYRFRRKSHYDPEERIHVNEFTIEKLDDDHHSVLERFQEKHEQKIYTLEEMVDIIAQTDYTIVAKYDGFDRKDANRNSLRITMVLRCPETR